MRNDPDRSSMTAAVTRILSLPVNACARIYAIFR
jgi:hypothetical protein